MEWRVTANNLQIVFEVLYFKTLLIVRLLYHGIPMKNMNNHYLKQLHKTFV